MSFGPEKMQRMFAAALRLYHRTERAELGLISAGVAFFGFLAIFPAAAALITIWGVAFDPAVIRDQISLLSDFLPKDVARLLESQVDGLLTLRGVPLGWASALSTLFALWSARAGVAAIIRGLNAVHGLPNRLGHWHQVRAMVLTLIILALALVAMVMTVVLPVMVRFLPVGLAQMINMPVAGEAFGLAIMVLAIALAFRYGPNLAPWRRPPLFSAGLLTAAVLWALSTAVFTLYLEYVPSYSQIYGSIGAVVALLIWLYVSAYAVLLGAAIDAERVGSAQP